MEQNYPPPVYPKTDPEWEKKRKQIFYDQIKRTTWMANTDDYQGKPRGRKSKMLTRVETKPRNKSEEQAFTNKFFNYNK